MKARNWCIVSLISVPVLLGQSAQVAGPVSGYVFDNGAHTLRPILGIPGASLFGQPVSLGFDAATAWIAPLQDSAFVTTADGTLHLFRLQSGKISESVVNGLTDAPDRVVFSPTGTAAALYRHGSIQTLRGLPDAPAIAGVADASAAGAPNSLAVSDDGSMVLVASGNAVEMYGSGGSLGRLSGTGGAALVAFAPGQHEAAVADPLGAGVLLFTDAGVGAPSKVVAPADQTLQSAAALAFSNDGQRLLLASPSGQNVITFDLAGGTRGSVACTCKPTALQRVGDRFRLTEFGSDPLWLLDARSATPSVVFVPAAARTAPRQPLNRIGDPRHPMPVGRATE